ncbi:universal stress protein [Streptomyces sp. PKU-MA01144]|uniref:universal stress protein n=1 Tax=Streptomyces TaxID=1883 RepID=UPI0014811C4E|nr:MULTISPECIES: universal stress protein [Streptomyces]MCY0983247.1 universal stress protein [Streptomyces tirandamycinicus]NNJ06527.1 universal stress protein [Streptomyces sp. PKU-MA01144]
MSRPIAVGVDGSDGSLAAADWAADEAALRGAPLRLVYATQWIPHQPQAVRMTHEERAEEAGDVLGAMEERVRTRRPELTLAAEEVEDAPTRVLLDAGAQADVLVVGTHGLSGIGGFMVGSVGQEVVADAKQPVVLVRPDYREDAHGTHGRNKVVLGLDIADPADEVLEFAFDYAARRGVPLHVLHSWHAPFLHRHRVAAETDSGPQAEIASALAQAVRPFRDKYPAVDVSEESAIGRPADRLVEEAADARLVVLGRHRGHGSHIGSTTHALIHHAACPVAVVPHG